VNLPDMGLEAPLGGMRQEAIGDQPMQQRRHGDMRVRRHGMLSQIAADKQNVIFAMEEPETAIPPYAQKRIVHEIRQLASQALFTSHSPYVLEEFAIEETVVLGRGSDGVLARKPISLPDNVKLKRYRQEFRTRFCEGLLARRILIAEGATEASAFPVVCRLLSELKPDTYRSLEAMGVCVVDAGIVHTAVVEIDAAILGAEIVAHLLQTPRDSRHFGHLIELLCSYYRGKGGEKPTSGALKQADDLAKAHVKWNAALASGKAPNAKSVIQAVSTVYEAARAAVLTGDPDKDWRTIRAVLEGGPCPRLREVGSEVRNIRILERGSQLRQSLTQDWRDNGAYLNALEIVRQAFVQDHFATGIKPETGVVIMNMHKAKGKQFDEVIIFEGWPVIRNRKIIANPHRIVRDNDRKQIADDVRQNFRVSVTRGRQRTTILTPKADPCVLLLGNS